MSAARDAILRDRENAIRAIDWAHRSSMGNRTRVERGEILGYLDRVHPLPRIERPRVLTDSAGVAWRVFDGIVQARITHHLWSHQLGLLAIASERAAIFASLFASPTETVEDDT